MSQVDRRLAETDIDPAPGLKSIQGPFAGGPTHIGRLALLRRTFRDPVPGENFMKASVQVGRLNREEETLSHDWFG